MWNYNNFQFFSFQMPWENEDITPYKYTNRAPAFFINIAAKYLRTYLYTEDV